MSNGTSDGEEGTPDSRHSSSSGRRKKSKVVMDQADNEPSVSVTDL